MAKILVVDDDPDIREACTLVLEAEGHEVHCAGNRSEGMTALGTVAPDLLVLDVMMEQPDDGMVMAQELRQQGSTVPILMLTSIGKVTGLDYDADASMVPVDDFVEKPVTPSDLVARIAALLSKKEG